MKKFSPVTKRILEIKGCSKGFILVHLNIHSIELGAARTWPAHSFRFDCITVIGNSKFLNI